MYDTIIIGAGPAGITASLYTHRSGIKTLVIYKGIGALDKADQIENYYGIEQINGKELMKRGLEQVERLGIDIVNEEVITITNNFETGLIDIITTTNQYTTKALILAIGKERKTLNIKGLKEFEGKGISYCATCDGFFYRQKRVFVIGDGPYAINEYKHLEGVTDKLVLLSNGKQIDSSLNINVNTKKIKNIRGHTKVEQIIFEDDTTIDADGIFIALGTASTTAFAMQLGLEIENNNIVTNSKMQTNISNIYACGDCVGGLLQIAKAINDGAQAGLSVVQFLKKSK